MNKNLVRQNVQIDYGTLKGSLPYNAVPCDMDGWLERNRYFLCIECKFDNAPPPKTGQENALKNLSKQPNWTVVMVEIERRATISGVYSFLPMRCKFFYCGKQSEWQACDLQQFTRFYKEWFDSVSKAPTPQYEWE